RRGFERELKRALAYVKRYGTQASLMFIDLDGFKAVNDRHGHGTGDALLKALSRQLIARLRASDIVGRLGGDEFGLVVWRVEELQFPGKAGELEPLIGTCSVMHAEAQAQVGGSMGTAPLLPAATAAEVIDAADRAMYVRKEERRHRFLPPLSSPV